MLTNLLQCAISLSATSVACTSRPSAAAPCAQTLPARQSVQTVDGAFQIAAPIEAAPADRESPAIRLGGTMRLDRSLFMAAPVRSTGSRR